MLRVLFVCYGNSCRSQMAEALANQLGEGKVQAFSAGTHPLGTISRATQEVLREKGIGLEGHWSKGLPDVSLPAMDVVVNMGSDVKCPLPADFGGRLIKWDIPDPYFYGRDGFREVRDVIGGEVRSLLAGLNMETGKQKTETRK